jgi:hypothetical protein
VELVGLALPVILVVAIGGAAFAWHHHRRQLLLEALHRLALRDGLRPTQTPCGLDRRQYADHFDATPRGDRRFGIEHALEGPAEVSLDGRPLPVQLACFRWWYEVRVQSDRSTSYQRRTDTVAVARLPLVVPASIRIKPEGILGRVGLRRADQQLESEEFNRRFHVRGSEPRLTVKLLDASMQHRLLTTATGRTIHLEQDLLVLGGSPTHRDPSFPGVIAELPAAAQDLLGLLRAVPAQVWRAATPVHDPAADRATGPAGTPPAPPPPGPWGAP